MSSANEMPVEGFSDIFLHEIIGKKRSKNKKKRTIFPFTRYDNVLNRPRVTSNIRESTNPDFMLVTIDEEEISSGEVFRLFNQTW